MTDNAGGYRVFHVSHRETSQEETGRMSALGASALIDVALVVGLMLSLVLYRSLAVRSLRTN